MIKKVLVKIIFIIFILIFGYFFEIYWPVNINNQEIKFVIIKGDGVNQIGQNLRKANLIRFSFLFNIHAWIKGNQADFKAGEYILKQNMSLEEISNKLTSNNALSKEKLITVIEGWDIDDIDNYLEKKNVFQQYQNPLAGDSDGAKNNNNFSSLAKIKISNWPFKISKPNFLNDAPVFASLEGFLFPDTYRLFQDATAEDMIVKMLNNFDKKITAQMHQDIIQQNKTIYQIIIMASIIEKEVRTSDDMQIVSGIFWNRLKNGQPFQSCATLAYVLGEKKSQYSLADTKINSPYNTYQNQGLPPGPIANPGLNAIKAAIYPKYTDYNYFLSRLDTGETVFSKIFEEHNRNKAKYLK